MGYWEDRARDRQKRVIRNTTTLEQKTRTAYQRAISDVNQKVKKFYRKYGVYEDSPVYKTLPDGTKEIVGYSKKLVVPYATAIQKYGKSNVTRLNRLNRQIGSVLDDLGVWQNTAYTEMLTDNYEEQYYDAIHEVYQGVGYGYDSFNLMPTKEIENAVKYPWSGENYSDRIWDDKGKLTKTLNRTLTNGIIKGDSTGYIAREIVKRMNTSYKNALRLARTEMTYSANRATMDGYSELGVEKYVYDAHLDSRTSEVCSALDGKVFNVEDSKSGVNLPPMHPNCRSTTQAYIKSLSTLGEQLAKDQDGNYFTVPKSMNAEDFKKIYVDKTMKRSDWNKQKDKKPKFDVPEARPSLKQGVFVDYADTGWSLAKEVMDETQKQLDKSPEFIRRAVQKTPGKTKVFDIKRDDAHYSPSSKNFCFKALTDYKGDRGHYAVFWHEYGHAIDDNLVDGLTLSQSDELIDAINKDYQAFKGRYKPQFELGYSKREGFEDVMRYDNDGMYKAMSKEILSYGDIGDGVQDIIGGISDHNVYTHYNHSLDYWHRTDKWQEISSEMFAHQMSAYVVQGKMGVMEHFFPETTKMFKKIVEDALQ